MKQREKKLVMIGALGALSVFLGITRLGFFPWISGVTITVLHIPAIIGAILEGPVVGCGIGLIFGLFSLLKANIAPMGPVDIAFRNPLVSVLPRIIFPLAVWALYILIRKINKYISFGLSAFIGTLIHTVLVLSMMWATQGSGILTGATGIGIWAAIGTVIVANGIPEAIAAAIIATAVCAIWLKEDTGRKPKIFS
ncbi:ECF transporter S component [Treponema phagedenis]|uniref:ECF transporter S component n=1 Tax=Treponema phagedenis TaxID=162 RepID=A0A0B7H038_TREPH|nr:ECF transporter S component [Treponema phagedenis]EFW39462.1 hypothetical protein HMPREF9554_00019 [Treponema phagedenis F0421]NVP24227.1 ECF transporter S component [Treponema phagedenis]QEJ94202.1 ECF transporter S component [Treponema phagedenis]QEJ99213.1 ECF transporter S component [Treponema phagedenis]QEK00160.1 ECF transporter S component [Treponema phagedenis]